MDELPQDFRACLSCTRSCYNEHGPLPPKDFVRPPCFVKALCDSNLAAMATCWLVIPSAWLKLYGDEVGNSAILHGPSGNTWQVGVGRPKWVAFRVGWRTFAADNCLEKGDMLVFTLIGNSEFSVKVFDSRTCLEKESSLTATNTGCYDSRSPVLLGEKRKYKEDDEHPPVLKRICVYENEGMHLGNKDQAVKSFRNGNGLHQSRSKLATFSSAACVLQRECTLLDLNSKPLCIHQNSPSDCGRSYPEVHPQLLDAVGARTLQEYPSGILYQPHPISIRSHNVGADCGAQAQSKIQEFGSGGLGPATRFASQRRPVMDATKERSSEFFHRQNSSSALITPEHTSHTQDLPRENFAQIVDPQILSPAVIIERERSLELARRAQDLIDRPSHLVVLRAFHVHGRAFVRFPVTFGKQHMPRKTAPMHLLDSNGHRWPMTWLRDNETHMGLTRGWRDFCLAEGLSEGDVCIFELIELNKLTLLIHVFRSSERKGSSQAVVTKPKRPNLMHVRHPVHKMPVKKKKGSEEGRGLGVITLGGEVKKQHSFMATKLVLYNALHRTTLPNCVISSKECYRGEDATTASVGRERLKRLSLWASKEQGCIYSSQRRFSHNTGSLEGLHLDMCSNDDAVCKDNDMTKVQATTYGEILCQMSSGCANTNTCPTTWNFELTRNSGKVHDLEKHKLGAHHSQGENCMKKHDLAEEIWRHKEKEVVKPVWNNLIQWVKTRKRYFKYDKTVIKTTSGWTRSTSRACALNRKMQASYRNPRIYLASRRSSVTEAQREAAKEAALALNTLNPAALVVMKKSNVYRTHTVELPQSFSRLLSSDVNINIFLRDAAGYKTKALLSEKALTRGWRQFSLNHLLEEGDVCVFELVDVSQLTVFVHIFRVVDVDLVSGSYQHHYRIISPGTDKWRARSMWRFPSDGQVVKETGIRTYRPRRSRVSRSLYLAIQNTRAKYREMTTLVGNEWFRRLQPLDLNLNVDPGNICAPIPSASCDSPTRTTSTSCVWRSPISELFLDIDKEPSVLKETSSAIQASNPEISHLTESIAKDICETSNETRQHIVFEENEKMIVPFPEGGDDSEPEEENYYRVVRILKKRYFQNEKQYLTELDGPVVQRDGCGGIREYDDMKWWVPEKSFSSGFASCYLR
ncbi:hypothetical protein KC19_VG008300 [Ceratodon purpureus]|uniref:TF-B3 domain-containing protein n=1 Tax=Ceratodon purpureus TaxID=3225 RepID=A0A8T0HKW5_CERPU|nr:hypothetical protein KC19_VG008300 [Ceratodon purpureus]KAG0571394.1 hypothetical protein KC19_VG008300 [Ceratodon purpureus]KAG0571395.1 hypothetical protein KC19_VG008300 [Ceratodon purpureus]KAG0571396.1 hypothetical protein KC19_VG008300 [Ceratodon purpureus]KAG0571397.1 hypothetical protein KC19_VG008300 [Ceratodon purpureus]